VSGKIHTTYNGKITAGSFKPYIYSTVKIRLKYSTVWYGSFWCLLLGMWAQHVIDLFCLGMWWQYYC